MIIPTTTTETYSAMENSRQAAFLVTGKEEAAKRAAAEAMMAPADIYCCGSQQGR
jgi:hypothetical protein